MNLKEKKLSGEIVYDGKLLKVHRDTVELPDGRQSIREYIRHPGAVVIIPFLPNGNILMERQFRYPSNQEFYELPAGKIDPGEALEHTARRELLEETGYEATSFSYIGKLHPGIGYTDEIIHIYTAKNLTPGAVQRDDDEFLEIFELSLNEARDWVLQGKITDAKTMVALLWATTKNL